MAQSEADGFIVELGKSGRQFHVAEDQTILRVLLDAGIDLQYSCEQGICGACEVKYLAGVPEHRDLVFSVEEHEAERTVMICCAGSQSAILVLDL